MSQNIIKNYDARQMGGRAPGGAPLDLPTKTRMPGKWGGARRARPPLDPPMLSTVHLGQRCA